MFYRNIQGPAETDFDLCLDCLKNQELARIFHEGFGFRMNLVQQDVL